METRTSSASFSMEFSRDDQERMSDGEKNGSEGSDDDGGDDDADEDDGDV